MLAKVHSGIGRGSNVVGSKVSVRVQIWATVLASERARTTENEEEHDFVDSHRRWGRRPVLSVPCVLELSSLFPDIDPNLLECQFSPISPTGRARPPSHLGAAVGAAVT